VDDGGVELREVDGDALGNIVVGPVAVAGPADGDVPLPGGTQPGERLDSLGNLLGRLGLQDTPGQDLGDGLGVVRGKTAAVVIALASGEEDAVAKTCVYEGVALRGGRVSASYRGEGYGWSSNLRFCSRSSGRRRCR
jgi:hypothetical protein